MNNPLTLNVHTIIPTTLANGPERRYGVWVQGCAFRCKGCFSEHTHAFGTGQDIPVDELVEDIILGFTLGKIDGITLSGGDPLFQLDAVLLLLKTLYDRTKGNLSVILFTGFTLDEIEKFPSHKQEILVYIDVLLAGRYEQDRHIGKNLVGSSNKQTHFLTDRYTIADIEATPKAEVFISSTGEVKYTGIAPVNLL